MTHPLSKRIEKIKPSATFAVAKRAAELKTQGKDIIGLGTGEPDFDTPQHIKDAAITAINKGQTKYTSPEGTIGLREAVAQKFKTENQLDYDPKTQIIVSVGAKQSLANAFQALVNPGDEVIIPAPYWVSYLDMTLLADGVPIILETNIQSHFKITPAQLEKAITPKTKLLLLNSPSNPSGVAYTKAELTALGAVLLKHPHIIILSDDIYEHIIWTTEPFSNIVMACPDLKEQTIVINGVSKAFAMTGWRIGYAAGPEKIISAMKKNQEQTTSGASSISQAAAEAGLRDPKSKVSIEQMRVEFKKRHDFLCAALNKIPGFLCLPAQGTFYSFVDITKAIILLNRPNIKDDLSFADYLLNEAGIAIVPGSAFGAPGCIRFSYATSMAVLEEAVRRLHVSLSER